MTDASSHQERDCLSNDVLETFCKSNKLCFNCYSLLAIDVVVSVLWVAAGLNILDVIM